MTAPAVVSWAVMLQGAALAPTLGASWLAFMASSITAWILGFCAVGELIADKLPFTPSRLTPGPLGARVVMGALSAMTLCVAVGLPPLFAAVLGAIGGVAGAWLGYTYRMRIAKPLGLPDLAAALIEDAIAVGSAVLIVSRL